MMQRYSTVQFGPRYASWPTVGYTLRDSSGATIGEHISDGVSEIPVGSGSFGVLVDLPDEFHGSIVWDTGDDEPVFAIEEINLAASGPAIASRDSRVETGGAGTVAWAYQLLNQNEQPIVQADVYATTDPEGRNVVAIGKTDALGVVRFRLDPGEVYLWRSKPGCVFANPDLKTVEAVE